MRGWVGTIGRRYSGLPASIQHADAGSNRLRGTGRGEFHPTHGAPYSAFRPPRTTRARIRVALPGASVFMGVCGAVIAVPFLRPSALALDFGLVVRHTTVQYPVPLRFGLLNGNFSFMPLIINSWNMISYILSIYSLVLLLFCGCCWVWISGLGFGFWVGLGMGEALGGREGGI
ncbi:hypothetical protein DENSPDRAFT_659916 [Dentipellis sp. KUC8613]|nr:hypothetical protein DENSPDRAFT_659916 [Dentipellis sp. KUC8613]